VRRVLRGCDADRRREVSPGPGAVILDAMFKACPECGGEFQSWVARCPDCDVALVITSGASPSARPAPRMLPHASELVCIERGDPWHLRELAERLQEQGVSCRIDVHPQTGRSQAPAQGGAGARGTQFGLYVRAEDAALAQQLRSDHLAAVVPDAHAPSFEPGAALSECPACGEPLAEGAARCASCELEFPEQGADG
jgi:hypothetical protein